MSIRTLFLVVELPFPTQGGGDLRVWQNVVGACGAGPVAVFGLKREPPADPPHPNIERWETSSDPTLTVAPEGPAALAWLADPEASPADSYLSETSAAEVRRLLDEFQPEVVVLEEVFLHRYIPLLAACRLVVDTFNVEAAVHVDLARAASRPHAALIRRRFADRVARIESSAYAAAERIWACSAGDKTLIEERYEPAAPVTLVPNGVDVDSYPTAGGGPYELIFPAGFAWLPNEQAALFLVEEVLPLLPAHAHLTLCGTHPPAAIRAVADPRVEVTGAVPDMKPYLGRAGCMPIALRDGGGTRLKAVEAFASRLPVVSTAKGVEGLGAEPGRHYLAAETADEFAAGIARLDREPELASALAAAAAALARDRYSWQVSGRVIREDLTAAVA